MTRGDFERLIQHHMDEVLRPRGFALTPQPPADVHDPEPFAVYEADPEEFARRYPKLGESLLDDDPCVDIWIKHDRETERLLCELEGHPLGDLLEDADLSEVAAMIERISGSGSLVEQLDAMAVGFAAALDANRA
ncbi:MAG: hypothetical protein ACRDKB_11885 [Actinomycetota bacterium]